MQKASGTPTLRKRSENEEERAIPHRRVRVPVFVEAVAGERPCPRVARKAVLREWAARAELGPADLAEVPLCSQEKRLSLQKNAPRTCSQ